MKSSLGQKYAASLFFGGLGADISPEMLDAKNGAYLEANAMGISNIERNVLQLARGDKGFISVTAPSATISYIGATWLNGYVVSFYRDSVTDLTYIWANGVLIGQHADYPSSFMDLDTNSETSEIYITDDSTVPIVLDLNDMIASVGTQKYFTDYDFKLYSINRPLQLNQPVFVQLEDLGPGGGLKYGSYAYSMCYSSISGEDTPFGPISPYIPVPDTAISLHEASVETYFTGLKTYGAGPSLTPGRYGIRLRLRIANLSGFDYIKIKRLANNTGQPISYTPTAEYIILGSDASGGTIDVKNNVYEVIEFVDSNSKDWAILDESVTRGYSTIEKARTIRYNDRRIVLGGVEYKSKLVDNKDIFILEENVTRIAFPTLKYLGAWSLLEEGFSSIYNQVYYKSHRCGERYGFGVKLHDEQGNTLFTVPLKHGSEAKNDFTNFKFPERRDKIPQGVKRMDSINLSGTIGSATILCNTISTNITFHLSLSQTATEFIAANAATFLAADVVLTCYTGFGQGILFFTSTTAGLDFTGLTTITTISGSSDLSGTVVNTRAAVPATPQVDRVQLLDIAGTADITCGIITRTIEVPIHNLHSLHFAILEFIESYTWVYAGIGVTITENSAHDAIIFTGPATGTSISTTAIGTLVENYYIDTYPVLGVTQMDTVTLTGTQGNAIVTCKSLAKGITFLTSLTITASKFVTDYAAAYAAVGIEVTSSGEDLIFTGLTTASFTTTIANALNNLTGTPAIITASAGGGGEIDVCTGQIEDSTVDSWNGADVAYVYDPVVARRVSKDNIVPDLNIISKADKTDGLIKPYSPVTPTGRGGSPRNNNYDGITQMPIMDTVDGHDNQVGQYGRYISTIGLRIGGIDTTKLPANVKAFSVVRTPAAGRVVCQGIGMYSLTQQIGGSPSLIKALDKLWFYSPEIDSIIGDKSYVYEDIKSNPSNYQLQLVAPCGFFSDFYSSYVFGINRVGQDLVSMPICGAEDLAKYMFPPDHDKSIGINDYITFGKWRNTANQGAGIDATLTFTISSAKDVDHNKNSRTPYLELSLGSNIYYSDQVLAETSDSAQSRAFHEPWYIVNIIQNKEVPNNNVNYYNDIGHSIRIESIIGESNGEAGQVFPLVEERIEDVYTFNGSVTGYRYIYVDGLPWLDTNNITADVNGYIATLETTGFFTPTGGDRVCYGLYRFNTTNLLNLNCITFPYIFSVSNPIVPIKGAKISARYNNNSPIDVFLGDTYVADASFLAIDATRPIESTVITDGFKMTAPMPHYDFTFQKSYHQAVWPAMADLVTTHNNTFDDLGTHFVDYIRQWLIYFTCESTINLPLVYKNFFPNKLYAMRPLNWTEKLDDETLDEFFGRNNIYKEYKDDYPGEYLNWKYGGLSTPASSNYDYQKLLPTKSYTEPKSGANEILTMPKRIHWSSQNLPGYDSTRVFIPTNVYDLKNDKASQISILYDVFSDRGSNLYVVTDRGAGMLLTDKNMITTAEGNNLSILTSEGGLIKGEVWLNASIGCPREFWRGKSEGSIKLPNNVVTPILAFPSYNGIVMLSNNNFVEIIDNNRKNILTSLEAIDTVTDFDTKLFSVIDEGENKLRMTIGNYTFCFNFDLNNWDSHIYGLKYDKSIYAQYLNTVTDRNALVHLINDGTDFGLTMSHKIASTRVTTLLAAPYVIFSVTPGLGQAYEFIDMYISSSYAPLSVQVAMDRNFTDSATVLTAKMQVYNAGWYYIQGLPRTALGKRLIGKTLFVKITFPDHLYFYDLRSVKTGFSELVEG